MAENTFSKLFDKVKEDPIKALEDTTKFVTATAVTVISVKTAIDAIRVRMMRSKKVKAETSTETGSEQVLNGRKPGSVDAKVAENRARVRYVRTGRSVEESDNTIALRNGVLDRIANTKDPKYKHPDYFKSLTHEQQYQLLKMERFDFRGFIMDEAFGRNDGPKFGQVIPGQLFREKVDYGIFNFFMQPLDEFVHWIKEDPAIIKPPQIKLVKRPPVPDVDYQTWKRLEELKKHKTPTDEYIPATTERQRIEVEELFRHKTLDEYRKAVNMRMLASDYNTADLLQLMKDDEEAQKKEKKGKKKSKGVDLSESFDGSSKKKKKHKGSDIEEAAKVKAHNMWNFYYNKALKGDPADFDQFKG